MLESRSAYGYYGEGHGATGETPPKKEHYTMDTFHFLVDWHDDFFSKRVTITAKNFKNAERNVKAWAKREGGTFLGEDPDFISINHYND